MCSAYQRRGTVRAAVSAVSARRSMAGARAQWRRSQIVHLTVARNVVSIQFLPVFGFRICYSTLTIKVVSKSNGALIISNGYIFPVLNI